MYFFCTKKRYIFLNLLLTNIKNKYSSYFFNFILQVECQQLNRENIEAFWFRWCHTLMEFYIVKRQSFQMIDLLSWCQRILWDFFLILEHLEWRTERRGETKSKIESIMHWVLEEIVIIVYAKSFNALRQNE